MAMEARSIHSQGSAQPQVARAKQRRELTAVA